MINMLHDYRLAEKNFFSMLSIAQENFGSIAAYATGAKASSINPAITHSLNDSFETDLKKCHSFYARKNLPWVLVIPEDECNKHADEIGRQQKLSLIDKSMTMVLNIESLQALPISSPIKIIEMQHDLSTWSIPLMHGFESTPEITEVYTICHHSASKKQSNLHHFSGFVGDNVVCSLSLSLIGGNARLDDIATMPRYQKQGHATQLILAALKFAQQLKAKYCFLEASNSGLSVYKKIGFSELYVNHHYEWQSA